MADSIFSREKLVPVIVNGVAVLAFGAALTGWLSPKLGVLIMAIVPLYWLWEILTSKTVSDTISIRNRVLIGGGTIAILAILFGPPAYRKLTIEEPKPLSASEIAEELSKRNPKRAHFFVIATGFNLGRKEGPIANVAFSNDGDLDAYFQELSRVWVNDAFFNNPDAQRQKEDELFRGIPETIQAATNAPVLQLAQHGQTFMAALIPLTAKQIQRTPKAIYLMGRIAYWDTNGKHYTDFCVYMHNVAEPVFQCKGHNEAP
jgi:hypothetical protein